MSSKIIIDNVSGEITYDGSPISGGGGALPTPTDSGSLLISDSSNAYVEHKAFSYMRNRIINGDMRVAQRGTAAVSANGAYPVDRFQVTNNVTNTFTAQYNSSVYPSGFSSSLLYTVGASGSPSGTLSNRISQAVEGNSVSDLGWGTAQARTITLSFWAKTSVPGTYSISVRNAVSVPRYSYISEYTLSSTNWEKKSITILGSQSGLWMTDNGVGLYIDFTLAAGPDYRTSSVNTWLSGLYVASNNQTQLSQTAGATFYLTGVQLELGSVATPFECRPFPIEINLCQRYYARMSSSTGAYVAFGAGSAQSTTVGSIFFKYPTTMRSAPVISQSSTSLYDSVDRSVTSLTYAAGLESASVYPVTSGLTVSRALVWRGNNSTSAYVELNAEL